MVLFSLVFYASVKTIRLMEIILVIVSLIILDFNHRTAIIVSEKEMYAYRIYPYAMRGRRMRTVSIDRSTTE